MNRTILCRDKTLLPDFTSFSLVIILIIAFTVFIISSPVPSSYAQLDNSQNNENLSSLNLTSGSSSIGKNWTTYSNNIFGISFDYPSDWEVNEKQGRFEKGPDVTVTDGQTSFKFIRFPKTLNDMLHRIGLTETVKQFERSTGDEEGNRIIETTDMKKYKIDGERTGMFLYTVDNEDGSSLAQQSFLVQHGSSGYFLIFGDSTLMFDTQETQSILQKIIESFRFIT